MKTIFLGFQSAADAHIKEPGARSRIVTTAVAIALAASAPLPTSPVDDAAGYFAQNAEEAVRCLGDCFNESVVFDLRACLEQARSFWLMRYSAAHPNQANFFAGNYCFYTALVGGGLLISPEQYEFNNKHKLPILHLASMAGALVGELKKNG